MAAADPEGHPGGRADHAVGGHVAAALEPPDGAGRTGAEDAVGDDAQPALQEADGGPAAHDADAATGARGRPGRGRAAARALRTAGTADHAPGPGADDPVGGQVVTALEALHRPAGARAEHAVGGAQVQRALELDDALTAVALLEGLGPGGGDG